MIGNPYQKFFSIKRDFEIRACSGPVHPVFNVMLIQKSNKTSFNIFGVAGIEYHWFVLSLESTDNIYPTH